MRTSVEFVGGSAVRRITLYPAVDIRGGQAVRLEKGDYAREKVYDADPLDAALRWASEGAKWLHVVDLDGAREGRPVNLEHVERIASGTDVPVQLGGGLRSRTDVQAALAAGARRVILGTKAFTDPPMLERVLEEHGQGVLVSVDVRDGMVTTSGWAEQTRITAIDAIERLQQAGVENFVFTDVSQDGTLAGLELDRVRGATSAIRGWFLYAGGIGSLDDLRALIRLGQRNLAGVIVGKALYEGRFTLSEAQMVLDEAANGGSRDGAGDG